MEGIIWRPKKEHRRRQMCEANTVSRMGMGDSVVARTIITVTIRGWAEKASDGHEEVQEV